MPQNIILLDHPLVKRDMTILRDSATDPELFRSVLKRISKVLAIEISRNLPLQEIEVVTPLEKTKGYRLAIQVVITPVLRAGLGMVDGFLEVIPEARTGHIGLKRDEDTLRPIYYYHKTPAGLEESMIIVLDPMLATGGSAVEAMNYLKDSGGKRMVLACLVAAPEGIEKVRLNHPEAVIYTAALDRELNSKGYILPGLGDAGDRIFGT